MCSDAAIVFMWLENDGLSSIWAASGVLPFPLELGALHPSSPVDGEFESLRAHPEASSLSQTLIDKRYSP